MRMRKKAWAEPFLKENADFVIEKPEIWAGHWREKLACQRLRIEIGSGKGDYFTKMAAMNPDEGWIGIEKEHNVAAVAAKKALAQPHEHMALIAQDADQLSSWFAEGELDVIHLNFSDPWPKSGYAKRRLSHARFLKQYEALLNPQGQVIMKTDNPKLFEFSLTEFSRENWQLREVSVDFRRQPHPEDAITEYEQ
ncbi:tRNA (guanosine(46)-N7)-methyltransferase TrmB, partial [Holdemania massiliensis]